jgi:hypothetical protein
MPPSTRGYELDQTSDEHWPLILRRHEHLAMQGSVRSAEFILKARTLARPPTSGVSEDADPSSHYTVNILVPRPPGVAVRRREQFRMTFTSLIPLGAISMPAPTVDEVRRTLGMRSIRCPRRRPSR